MSATMKIIPSLRKFTKGYAEVQVSGTTVMECIEDLETQFPGIKHQIFEEDEKLRSCFDVYVNSPDSFKFERLAMPVKDGGELAIIPVFGPTDISVVEAIIVLIKAISAACLNLISPSISNSEPFHIKSALLSITLAAVK